MSKIIEENVKSIIRPVSMPDFVDTPYTRSMTEWIMAYIKAGFAVHLRGYSGTGKTSMALHVANMLGRPIELIHGNEDLSVTDLIGGRHGYRMRKVVDKFVHSVVKTEEDVMQHWVDGRLTTACKQGYTLVYDEFTRSRPETNNIFLTVLQEKVLDLPIMRGGEESYVKVHPSFTAIFTSNPEEYAGVYRSQDALRERMVTLDLDFFDEETEVQITASNVKIEPKEARKIVSIMRKLRESSVCECPPTVRGCIMIGKTLKVMNIPFDAKNDVFRQICIDVLASETSRKGNFRLQKGVRSLIVDILDKSSVLEGN
ncbi:MAG: gas vesicle protein GvpN [Bacillota bacterium]